MVRLELLQLRGQVRVVMVDVVVEPPVGPVEVGALERSCASGYQEQGRNDQ